MIIGLGSEPPVHVVVGKYTVDKLVLVPEKDLGL